MTIQRILIRRVMDLQHICLQRLQLSRRNETMKWLIVPVMMLLLVGAVSAMLPMETFTNLELGNGQGHIDDVRGHVTMNLKAGWNLLPLEFIMEASGRYWSNKDDLTCSQDVFHTVWVYSPVEKKYTLLPRIDDWGAPVSRNNVYLQREFAGKYFHIFDGSGWIFTPNDCTLEGDSGVGIVAKSFGMVDQGIEGTYEELVMKAGWNYIPIDYYWPAMEHTFGTVFSGCNVEKYYLWDNAGQRWIPAYQEGFGWNEQISPLMTFTTLLVKSNTDCRLAKNIIDGPPGAVPPALPP